MWRLYYNQIMRVLVFGTFDDLHPGHRWFLEEANARGELFVVVARDANVERLKGRQPVQSETERQAGIVQSFPAARIVLGDPEDFLAPVRSVGPDLVVLGYDQHLPPGVREQDLPCPIERLPAYHPEEFKSSLRRGKGLR
jgi:FAD synthetase